MKYPVHYGVDAVGSAIVSKEGLYYRIQCICHVSNSEPFRITAEAEHSVDLGLCVPNGHASGLEVRIPIKKFGEGNLRFYIRTKQEAVTEDWFPVSASEAFPYIAKLKTAYMVSHDAIAGVKFKESDQFPGKQDNGQNP